MIQFVRMNFRAIPCPIKAGEPSLLKGSHCERQAKTHAFFRVIWLRCACSSRTSPLGYLRGRTTTHNKTCASSCLLIPSHNTDLTNYFFSTLSRRNCLQAIRRFVDHSTSRSTFGCWKRAHPFNSSSNYSTAFLTSPRHNHNPNC